MGNKTSKSNCMSGTKESAKPVSTSIETQTTNLDLVSMDEVDDFPVATNIPTPIQFAQTPLTKSIAYHLLRLRQNNGSLDQSVKQMPSLMLRRRIANDLGFPALPPYALASPMDPRSPLIDPRTPFDLNAIDVCDPASIESNVQGKLAVNRKLNISDECINDEGSCRGDEPAAEQIEKSPKRTKVSMKHSKTSVGRTKASPEHSKPSTKVEVSSIVKRTSQNISRLPRTRVERMAWTNSLRKQPTRKTNRKGQQEEPSLQVVHTVEPKLNIPNGDDKENSKENKKVKQSVESEERPSLRKANQDFSRLPKAIEQLKMRRNSKQKRIKKSSQEEEPGLLVTSIANQKTNHSNGENGKAVKEVKEMGTNRTAKKINLTRRAKTELELTRAQQCEGKRIMKNSQQEKLGLLATHTGNLHSNGIDHQEGRENNEIERVVENEATANKKRANQNILQPKAKYDQTNVSKIEEKRTKKVSRQEDTSLLDSLTVNLQANKSNGFHQQKSIEKEEVEQVEENEGSTTNKNANQNGLQPKTKNEQSKTPKFEEKKTKKGTRNEKTAVLDPVAVNRLLSFLNGDNEDNGGEETENKSFTEIKDTPKNQITNEQTKRSQNEQRLEKNNQNGRLDLPIIAKVRTINRKVNISFGKDEKSGKEEEKAKLTTENVNNSTTPKNEVEPKKSDRSVHIYLSAKHLLRPKNPPNGRMPLSLISQTSESVEKTPTRSVKEAQVPKSASRIPIYKR